MCNNMLLAIQMEGTAEALRLGIAHGLDPARLSEIMSKSSGRNWALEVYNPCPGVMPNSPASRGYAGGFASDLMLKDVGLAVDAARALAVATPLGLVARQIYLEHHQRGHGQLDFSSVFADPVDAATLLARLG
jgi:3-hydroxyisobutyrate dehydrogenase